MAEAGVPGAAATDLALEANVHAPVAPTGPWSLLEVEIAQSIGSTVRALRRDRNMTLQDVADRAGLSLGMVSKIENAQASPSLRTLAQLSQALAVPVPLFFRELSNHEDASFVRAGEGIELARPDSRHGYRYELLAAQLGSRRVLQPFLVTIAHGAEPYPLFQHTGSEFIFVLEGALTYRYGTTTYDLAPGDSLLIHGPIQHGPETLTVLPIRLLSITLTRSDEAVEMP